VREATAAWKREDEVVDDITVVIIFFGLAWLNNYTLYRKKKKTNLYTNNDLFLISIEDSEQIDVIFFKK
jgi:hypothetical protein